MIWRNTKDGWDTPFIGWDELFLNVTCYIEITYKIASVKALISLHFESEV